MCGDTRMCGDNCVGRAPEAPNGVIQLLWGTFAGFLELRGRPQMFKGVLQSVHADFIASHLDGGDRNGDFSSYVEVPPIYDEANHGRVRKIDLETPKRAKVPIERIDSHTAPNLHLSSRNAGVGESSREGSQVLAIAR